MAYLHGAWPMAARLRKAHQDDVRLKIQASQLINRLEDCALGDLELSAAKLKAIEILLRKSLPDLTATEISGPDGEDLAVGIKVTYAEPS